MEYLLYKLPLWLSSKESTYKCRRPRRNEFSPSVGKIPWRRAWLPPPVFLPGKSHGQRSLAGCRLWGRRVGHSRTEQVCYTSVHCLESLKAHSIAPVFKSWDSGCVTCSAPCSQSGSLTDPPGLGPELAHYVCYDTGPTKVHTPKPRVSPEGRP